MEFEAKWQQGMGNPERSGSWLIFGDSGNGKTTFTCQLAKYLCNFGKVVFNSLEEGAGLSMQNAFKRVGMEEVRKRIILLDGESSSNLYLRLKKHKSPDIIIVDSIDYAGLNFTEYKTLKKEFPNKLFIFTAHATGRIPDNRIARKVRFDANIKIHIEGYKAFIKSRYGGGKPIIIWEEGAAQYHGYESKNSIK